MIDKLCVRIPPRAPFTPEFQPLYTALRDGGDVFRPNRHYQQSGDLSPYGYEVILQLHCRRDRIAAHKVDVIDCGKKSFSEIKRAISSIFVVDLDELPVMRLDLAADVPGVPVDWFRNRIHARNKRLNSAYLLGHRREIRKANAQTLYFGRRPNLFRIYNKHEEWKHQYRTMLRKTTGGAEVPAFDALYGVPEDGYVLTRVEREMGGSRLSRSMRLKHLKGAVGFRPFDPLEIIAGGMKIPKPEDYTLMDYAAGMYFRDMAERAGMQAVMHHLRRHSNGNTQKYLQKFRDFLPSEHPEVQLNAEYLNQLYQRSVWEQLAA